MKKYILAEEGEYSDYSVSIIELPENCTFSDEELEKLLSFGSWNGVIIGGHITGEVHLKENTSIGVKNLNEEVTQRINSEFACYPNRAHTTILDKVYSKEELIKIAQSNDSSGQSYWEDKVNRQYQMYLEIYELYHKI